MLLDRCKISDERFAPSAHAETGHNRCCAIAVNISHEGVVIELDVADDAPKNVTASAVDLLLLLP